MSKNGGHFTAKQTHLCFPIWEKYILYTKSQMDLGKHRLVFVCVFPDLHFRNMCFPISSEFYIYGKTHILFGGAFNLGRSGRIPAATNPLFSTSYQLAS